MSVSAEQSTHWLEATEIWFFTRIHLLPLTEHEIDSEVHESMATQMIHNFDQEESSEISGAHNEGGQLGKLDTHMIYWPEVRLKNNAQPI